MFTKDNHLWLQIYFNSTKPLSNAPFEYIPRARMFQEKPLASKSWYIFLLCWCLSRTVWHICWVISNFFCGLPPIFDTALEAAFRIFNVAVLVLCFEGFLNRGSITSFSNRMLALNAKLKANFMLEQSRDSNFKDGCAVYIELLTPCFITVPIVAGLLFTLQPSSRIYFYRFIPMPTNTWTFVVYTAWECYSICWQVGVVYILWLPQLLYAKSSAFWIRQIT